MKALKISTLLIYSTFFYFLIMMAACGGNDANQTDKTASASAGIAPPKIDIHTAVITEDLEALKQHVASGTDINERDPFGGSSPLISAAVFGKPEAAKLLIENGADINFQNNDGSTALLTAAFFCRPEIVKMLLDHNADKTIKNKYGQTAYEAVLAPFSDVKGVYDIMTASLAPMGFKLDYTYVEKTRPEIAEMLK